MNNPKRTAIVALVSFIILLMLFAWPFVTGSEASSLINIASFFLPFVLIAVGFYYMYKKVMRHEITRARLEKNGERTTGKVLASRYILEVNRRPHFEVALEIRSITGHAEAVRIVFIEDPRKPGAPPVGSTLPLLVDPQNPKNVAIDFKTYCNLEGPTAEYDWNKPY